MHPHCLQFRADALVAFGPGSPGSLPRAASDHADSCAACRAWVESNRRLTRALGVLERHMAPAELDERVAFDSRLHPVVAALRSLGPRTPPPELDDAVDAEVEAARHGEAAGPGSGMQAPGVLERLIGEELADPPKARARRFLGSLSRQTAPAALDSLVADVLERAPSTRRPRLVLVGSALAAALVVAVSLPGILRPTGAADPVAPVDRPFATGTLTDLGELDPMAAGLLTGVLGAPLNPGRSE